MQEVLPLTVIEELMYRQDCPAYPYTCVLRLRFSGRLDREAMERAAEETLVRHPMLSAALDTSSRRPRWRLNPPRTVPIEWRDAPVSDEFPQADYLDIARGGLRLIAVVDAERSELLMQFYHSCCDGAGSLQFLHDLVVLYAQHKGATLRRPLPKYEPERLANRGRYGLTFRKLLGKARRQSVGLKGVRQFLARQPVPLVPHEREPDRHCRADVYPAACAEHFSVDESAGLRQMTRRTGVTTNDLLARDLFVALAEFRRRRGLADDQWLRLMVPVDLRSVADRRLPAATVVSSVFLDRTAAMAADRESLLAGIHHEMDVIKDNELGFTFVFSLYVNRLLFGSLRRASRAKKCETTAAFTNLGVMFGRTKLPSDEQGLICGDVRLERVEIIAPLTPYACATFAAGWFAGRLSLTLHYDPRPLTKEDARELLDLFAAQVRSTAGSESAEG